MSRIHRDIKGSGNCQELGGQEKGSRCLVDTERSMTKNFWALVTQQYEGTEMWSNLPNVTSWYVIEPQYKLSAAPGSVLLTTRLWMKGSRKGPLNYKTRQKGLQVFSLPLCIIVFFLGDEFYCELQIRWSQGRTRWIFLVPFPLRWQREALAQEGTVCSTRVIFSVLGCGHWKLSRYLPG